MYLVFYMMKEGNFLPVNKDNQISAYTDVDEVLKAFEALTGALRADPTSSMATILALRVLNPIMLEWDADKAHDLMKYVLHDYRIHELNHWAFNDKIMRAVQVDQTLFDIHDHKEMLNLLYKEGNYLN